MSSSGSSSEGTQSKKAALPQSQQAEFTFVSDQTQHEARSHAMREHWKQRRQRRSMDKKKHEDAMARPQFILPLAAEAADSAVSDPLPSSAGSSDIHSRDSGRGTGSGKMSFEQGSSSRHGGGPPRDPQNGIPAQVLSTMNLALGSCKLDPFDKFPVKLTHRHHQLLHHWLVTYSAMIFDSLSTSEFNPMRDVWLPLDFSNAASFNAVMAHSAAHLSRMQGYVKSETALKFKNEAIRIVAVWMGDPKLCLSDDIIAAVLRLLTFERYWGTEAEWRVHHEGLLRLIEARGGFEALQDNWRVSLPTYLVSLMSCPSWFDTSNHIWEISEHTQQTWLYKDMHKVRCLWLLSFVQDIGAFVCNSPDIYADGLNGYPAVLDALDVLKTASQQISSTPEPAGQTSCGSDELERLACIFYICVLVQISFSIPTSVEHGDVHALSSLNWVLDQSRSTWQGSAQGLYVTFFNSALPLVDGLVRTEYVLRMARILGSLSVEARHGVEDCLLYILRQAGRARRGVQRDDMQVTPDHLLASIHGD